MAKGNDPRRSGSGARKASGAAAASRKGAGTSKKITERNTKRRARNADKPGQGEAGTRHIDSPHERDRGPVGVKGQSAPGHSRPGRR